MDKDKYNKYIEFATNYDNLSIKDKFNFLCGELKSLCDSIPTCDGCPRRHKHIGCDLRETLPRDIKNY